MKRTFSYEMVYMYSPKYFATDVDGLVKNYEGILKSLKASRVYRAESSEVNRKRNERKGKEQEREEQEAEKKRAGKRKAGKRRAGKRRREEHFFKRRRLSYPIKGFTEAYTGVIRYDARSSVNSKLFKMLEYDESILRYFIQKLADNGQP